MYPFTVRVGMPVAVASRLRLVRATWAEHRTLLLIVSGSVLLRVVWALVLGQAVTALPGIADQESYHALALRVVGGHGFTFASAWWPATGAGQPTAHWSYLYVVFLAAVYTLFGPAPLCVRLLQSVAVGVLQPVLTYRIAARLFGRRVALVAAAVVAGYAYFVYYAGALMTESLYIVAILWSIDIAQRLAGSTDEDCEDTRLWLQLGCALGAAVLLRQVMVLMVPLELAWVIWHRAGAGRLADVGRRPRQTGWLRGSALATGLIVLAVAPWTLRNYRAFGQFVPLNTNAGFAFFWGNHPVHGTSFIPILPGGGSEYGRLIPDDLRGLNEAQLDRALFRRGVGFVVAEPMRYLRLSLSRVTEHVRFWPTHDSGLLSNVARAASFGVCVPLFVVGIALALHRYHRGTSVRLSADQDPTLSLVFAGAYSLIHVLTWTLVRYRLPVDAVLIPFAALALVWLRDVICVRPLVAWRARLS